MKIDKEAFHFEIQQGSITGSVIEELLLEMENNPEAKILISDPEDIQYQIHKRLDGSLRTFVNMDGDQISPSKTDEIKVLGGKTSKLTPFFSQLTVGMWVSACIFSLSFAAASIAGSVAISISATESNYKDAIANNPVAFATQNGLVDKYKTTSARNLPSIGGAYAIKRHFLKNNSPVGKLIFRQGSWTSIPHQQKEKTEVE